MVSRYTDTQTQMVHFHWLCMRASARSSALIARHFLWPVVPISQTFLLCIRTCTTCEFVPRLGEINFRKLELQIDT